MIDFEYNLMNLIHGFICVHDINSKLLMANVESAKVMGFISPDEAVGKTYGDLPCSISEQHDDFITQDQKVFSREKTLTYLSYGCYENGEWFLMHGVKKPFKNPKNNTVQGFVSHWQDVTNYRLIDISRFLIDPKEGRFGKLTKKPFTYILSEKEDMGNLSLRQKECVFFLIRGGTSKTIAKVLDLQHGTIDEYIEDIKQKMDCSNRRQIIEKAYIQGWNTFIPKTLLSERELEKKLHFIEDNKSS